jgi:hypothetical protein
MYMKRVLIILTVCISAVSLLAACGGERENHTARRDANGVQPTPAARAGESASAKNPMGNITKDSKPFGAYDVELDGNRITGTVVNNSEENTNGYIYFETYDENGEATHGGMLANGLFGFGNEDFLAPGEERTFSCTVQEGTVSFKYSKFYLITEAKLRLDDAELLISAGKYQEAQVIIEDVLSKNPNNTDAKQLQARIQDSKEQE